MKIIIDGTPYDIIDALQGAALGDLRDLKKSTAVTVNSIQREFISMGEKIAAAGGDESFMLDDDGFLSNMIGLIWLVKRKAGESVTIADAEATPFDSFSFDFSDDADEEAPEVPKDEAVASTDPSV